MTPPVRGDRGSSQSKKHALVIPFSLQAHTSGIFRLAVQLAKKGVTITFITVAKDIPEMKTYEELQGLDFNLISYDASLVPPTTNEKLSDILDFVEAKRDYFQPILRDLKANQKAGLPGPTCIIYDRFLFWMKDVHEELNIPLYTFFSCGAILARYLQEVPRLFCEGTLVMKEDKTLLEFEGHVYIPGLPPLQYSDIPASGKIFPQWSIKIEETMEWAEAIIINTFRELEHPQTDEIQRQLTEHSAGRKTTKLFLIGPVANASTDKDRSFQHTVGLDRGADSLRYLDRQGPQSVVYICCGSVTRWNALMIYELAVALDATAQSFLWVLQTDPNLTSLDDALPAGFGERTRARGLIMTTWVPQLQILAHPSVGCFITHCGWNSLIESVTSGLPIIGWPQGAEQHMNCKYFAEVLKIGVQVGRGMPRGYAIPHEEFEKALRLVMVEEEGKAMRSRVQKLMLQAKGALADGGPIQKALSEIAESIPGEGKVATPYEEPPAP